MCLVFVERVWKKLSNSTVKILDSPTLSVFLCIFVQHKPSPTHDFDEMCKQFLTFSRDVVILKSVGRDELNNLRYSNLLTPWSLLPKFDNHVCVCACVCLCGLGCMLVEKQNAQGKFNTIKSRTIPPKYQKILSSPSSTFFTMTASLGIC